MRLVIVIAIAFISLFYLWRRNHVLYYKGFVNGMNKLNVGAVYTYNVLHAPPTHKPLEVSENFIVYSGNMFIKFIHFTIFSVVMFLWGDNIVVFWVLTFIYSFLVIVGWGGYKARKKFYNEINQEFTKEAFTPILKASICMPVYQTIIYILLFFV